MAKAADGSMRDALSLLDQCVAFHYGDCLTYDNVLEVLGAVDSSIFSELLRAVFAKETSFCIRKLEEWWFRDESWASLSRILSGI